MFINTLMIVTGGRDKNIQDSIITDVYDTETSEWRKFPSIGLFRHSCFIKDTSLYIYGGFENKSPNFPILNLYKIDLQSFFSSSSSLLYKLMNNQTKSPQVIKQESQTFYNNTGQLGNSTTSSGNNPPSLYQIKDNQTAKLGGSSGNNSTNSYANKYLLDQLLDIDGNISAIMDNNNKNQMFMLSNQAIVIQANEEIDDMSFMRKVDIDKLSQESKRIGQDLLCTNVQKKRFYNEDIINNFIDTLLRPFDWVNNKDLDSLHANLPFSKEDRDVLLRETARILQKEKSLLSIRSPVKVFGNLFGQYYDLMRFFETYGNPSDVNSMGDININSYLFLGDFIDRGIYSLEVIFLLFALKVKYPESIFLVRGHHEDENVNKKLGLFDDCEKRLDDPTFYNKLNVIFDLLPLGCLIDSKILCVHGGIGSSVKTLYDIANIQRPISVVQDVKTNEQQIMLDLLYSEYSEDVQLISSNEERDTLKSGFILKYGKDRISKFLADNNLSLLITSHTWIPEGVKAYNNEKILITYSSTNHMDKAGNIGGMINITKNCAHAIPKLIDVFKTDRKFYKKTITTSSPIRIKK